MALPPPFPATAPILGYSWLVHNGDLDRAERFRVCVRCVLPRVDRPDVAIVATTNRPPACQRCGVVLTF